MRIRSLNSRNGRDNDVDLALPPTTVERCLPLVVDIGVIDARLDLPLGRLAEASSDRLGVLHSIRSVSLKTGPRSWLCKCTFLLKQYTIPLWPE